MSRSKERGEVAAAAEEVEITMMRARMAEVNKRKHEELSDCSSSLVQRKRRRRIAVTDDSLDDACRSSSSGHALSSSNASSELAKVKLATIDLLKEEDEEASSVEIATSATYYNMKEREGRETTPLSELQAESAELECQTIQPSQANSLLHSTASKMPSDAELEDFFSAAEKDLQKQFAEKYNFDIVKEEPLKGRYEWIRVKP